ncbi:UDP-2,4-diacetamido-2,4,6-trideoxy-beta-L-altropyranose hydrolase [Hymenobacter sp. BT188]|uniref:UDP-2,4-diacetamido-2,4, 6-trideoxy-beta-L-altropyranose hydrolase n=1 Tax=Hymenobacter sp. BT188 TaxID=2763504 RepID=UPI001651585C|nr:UDP-2,4-diacetamido-2,4,6-trideoxy-beta-L-altropyranose hydrolase [Hymenobacter sp. BT188]MBC6607748.1 UDP-2,4-diacetamido-2,4,6-trideoxy-beta-L-altropyranose hydrolase [Hymenobacter sp. BT188]
MTAHPSLPRLVLRADGNPRIGLGHVMRLLALADILRDEFGCVFVIQEPDAVLLNQLQESCSEVVEMPPQPAGGEPAWLAQHVLRPNDILVLDGYGFELSYQEAVRAHVAKLVCLDDLHAFPFAADLVLNPAGGISEADYDLRQPGARLLSGPAYAPLRAAFCSAAPASHTVASPSSVLVCLGGADPTHQTQRVAATLLTLPVVEQVQIVVGSAYTGWESLSQWAEHEAKVTLHRNLPPSQLAELMQSCGAAVCSPSTISYEYCAAGGGLLFLLPTAANQHDLHEFLRAAGMALLYPSAANVLTSPEVMRIAEQLRTAQKRYFDGQAPARLRQAFKALRLPDAPFRLRLVTAADSAQLLAWTNEPTVRQASFNPQPVPAEFHERWLNARLADPYALMLLAEEEATGAPVGLIRFSISHDEATLSYLLDPAYRGRGWAAVLLALGTTHLVQTFPHLRRIVGHVQLRNQASLRAFERAGYALLPVALSGEPDSVTFAWWL